MQLSRVYQDGKLTTETVDLSNLGELAKQSGKCIWLDLVDPTKAELDSLGKTLGIHALAVEDVFKGGQRPKLEHTGDYLFINAYSADFDNDTDQLRTPEIGIFATKHVLVTVRDDHDFAVDDITRRWDESYELAEAGVGFLLWGLLDVIVDSYFTVIEKLDLEIEELEDLLFSDARDDKVIQRRSYDLRKALVTMRRTAIPMREILNPLVKHDTQVINDEMFQYFQDVYDHTMRVADFIDSQRDLVTTLLETNLTIQGNHMNLIMKKVTSWAAIIAVPTAITGWYGQNIPYPGFSAEWGVWASGGSIVLISLILYAIFKRRDWI